MAGESIRKPRSRRWPVPEETRRAIFGEGRWRTVRSGSLPSAETGCASSPTECRRAPIERAPGMAVFRSHLLENQEIGCRIFSRSMRSKGASRQLDCIPGAGHSANPTAPTSVHTPAKARPQRRVWQDCVAVSFSLRSDGQSSPRTLGGNIPAGSLPA